MLAKELLSLEGAKKAVVACAALSLIRALSVLGQAVFLSEAVCGLWSGSALSDQAVSVCAFAACFLIRELAAFAQESYIDSYALRTVSSIREKGLSAVYENRATTGSGKGTPATVALLIEGGDDVSKYIRLAFPKMTDCAIVPIVLLAGVFALDVISGAIALICLPFIFIFMKLIGWTAKDEAAKRHAQFEKLSDSFVNKASGIVDLKSFGTDGLFAKLIYKTSESFREITMRTLRVSMLSSAVLDLFATLALAAVAIMLGFRMVEGTIAFFPALAVLVIIPEYFKPIREFGNNYHETLAGKESLASLMGLLAQTQDGGSPVPYWASSLKENARLEIDTSEHKSIAITGTSGAGKTTLLNALAGIADPPDDFEIIVDGEIRPTLRDGRWGQRVAYIPQEPHIFGATVRENVSFYRPDATDAEIMRALEMVGLSETVDGLEDGLDTKIGEGGRALSGGQLERIAMCRALLDTNRDIWMLDEPSAHIDDETSDEIMECIFPLLEERTAFVVTHDPKWAKRMDEELRIETEAEVNLGETK